MSLKHYTPVQIQELLRNPYVSKCSPKSITYTYECKIKILHLYEQEKLGVREAFMTLGFPQHVIQSRLPYDCMKIWKRIVSKQGSIGLKEGKRGRKKKEKLPGGMSPPENETVEYLKAKIAYLEEENKVFTLIRAGKYQ